MANPITDLELRNNNPYSIGSIFIFPEGDFLLDRTPISVLKSIGDRYHTVINGNTLSSIAFQYYNNSKYWWTIADANELVDLFTLVPGTILLIPDLNQIEISTI